MKLQKYWLIILITGILTAGLTAPVWANPALRVDQTVPDTFINDSIGETYKATITNIGDMTALNIGVSIDIPSGFNQIGTPTAVFKTWSGDSGTSIPITVSGSGPINISFNTPLSLDPNQIVEITYQLNTTMAVMPGNSSVNTITVNENYNYLDIDSNLVPTNESYQHLVYVKQGIINVTLTPLNNTTLLPINPFQASRGDIITLEAKLTNTGDGPLYNVNFNAVWGANFGSPQLVGGNVTPTLSGNSYTYTTGISDAIQPGASVYFRYQLMVSDYHSNFSLTSSASTNPISPGTPSSASAIFTFIINQPNISITPDAITIDYGALPQATKIVITNSGTGPARQFKLNTGINSLFTVSNVSSDWTYTNGIFTYIANSGVINSGDIITLAFSVTPTNPAALQADPSNGNILITPSYLNDIDQPFGYPVVYQDYSIINVPILKLAQTINTPDGDNSRIYLGEQLQLVYTPTLTHTEKWTSTQIVLTDVVTNDFTIIGTPTVEAGTIQQNGNTITWLLTPSQAAANPKLTINLQATTDPNRAGNFIDNSAIISDTTLWCSLNATQTASFYLQSRNVQADFTYQSKSITNLPAEGSYDVCGKDSKNIVGYRLKYIFAADSGGNWTNSTLSDELNQQQTYVNGSAQYSTDGNTWYSIPPADITVSSKLTVNLGFLTDTAFEGIDSVQGKTVYFKYQLSLIDASLPLGVSNSTTLTFTSVTDLTLTGASGGAGASNNTFYQGVFVPISRSAMNIAVDLGTSVVSKGQVVHSTLNIGNVGNTPWDKKNLIITLTTPTASGSSSGSYSYLGPLILDSSKVTGFNNLIPTVTIIPGAPEQIQFQFLSPVTVGGTISFDLVKTDSDNYTVQTKLDFDDDLNDHSTATASYTPVVCEQGMLSLIVNPDPIQVNANTITWQINVTNIGNGIAYGTVVTDNLNGILAYASSIPSINSQNGTTVTWSLGNLNPGDYKAITVTAHTNNNSDFTSNTNTVTGELTWVDRNSVPDYFNINTVAAKPDFINENSTSSTFVENLCDDHVELGSIATIKLHVKNNGWTTNYNYIVTQNFEQTGFVYQPGTAAISGSPVSDPVISGNTLTFAGLSQFQAIAPQGEFYLTFQVYAPESFNSYQKIRPSATWQLPTDFSNRSGAINGAEFLVPQFLPNITVMVDGKESAADDSAYTKNVVAVAGDIIKWRIRITNSGTADAKNVTFKNIIPANMTFNSISAFISNPSTDPVDHSSPPANTLWGIADVAKGTTATYYILATFTGSCGPVQQDAARVTWGPETSSLSTPGHNTDSANFITQPVVNSVTASISNFTTKVGRVTVTLTTSGAPLHDLILPLDITNRFVVSSGMTYGGGLPAPVSVEPAIGASGILTWNWVGGVPLPAGTYTITFDIRDNNNSNYCSDGSRVNTLNNHYTFKNSRNVSLEGYYDLDATPAKTTLTITKVLAVRIGQGGNTYVWTTTVKNTGNTAATNLEIVDTLGNGTLGNGFDYQSSTVTIAGLPTADTPNQVGNILTWSNKTLNAGDSYVITENVTANDTGVHTTSVTATEWNIDKTRYVDQQTAKASLELVSFTKTLDQTTGNINDSVADSFGEIVQYTIQMKIDDLSNYQNTVITDTLPAGLELVDQTPNFLNHNPAVSFAQNGKVLTWNIGNFTGQETITITYHARIIKEGIVTAGTILTNAANVSFDIKNDDSTITSFPNTTSGLQAAASFTVKTPSITLSSKSSNPLSTSSVIASQAINHTLVVTNANGANISAGYEIKVTETLPVGERAFNPTSTVIIKKGGSGGTTLTAMTDYTISYDGLSGALIFTFLNTGLGILQPNENFTITYQTEIDVNIGAGFNLTNSTTLNQYYSQPSTATKTQVYTGNTLTTSYNTINSSYTMTVQNPVNGRIRPGMTVTYKAQITIPAGTSAFELGLSQTLPTGLDYVSNSSVGLNDTGGIYRSLTPSLSGDPISGETLTWSVAGNNVDITNSSGSDLVLTITFDAVVLDAAAISNGNVKTSNFVYNYDTIDNNSGSRTNTSGVSASLTVAEPALTITKTILSSGPYEAGNTLKYRLTVTNTSATETAYDAKIDSLLSGKVTYGSNSPSTGMQFSQNGQQLTWGADGALDINAGTTVTIDVTTILNTLVEPNEVLQNTGTVAYSSMDGTVANERAYNTGIADANDITINDPTVVSKSIMSSPTYVIGEPFNYKIVLTILKGTTENVIVKDTLPTDLELVSYSIINGNGGISYGTVTGPSGGATGNISWNFGTVTNPDNGIPNDETITIQYTVRLLDSTNNNAGNIRTNLAKASYSHYVSGSLTTNTTAASSQSFTIKEPQLVMSKSYANGTYDAGDTVHVTIQVWHNPTTSPNNVNAYDVVVSDPIPAGMTYVNGTADNNGVLNAGSMTWNISTMDLSFSSANKLTLSYDLKLDDTGKPGQTFNSTATTNWTSLAGTVTGERTGTGGVNDYVATGAASTQITDRTALVKTITGSGPYPVGATVSYRLTITLNEGTTNSVVIKDVLPAGLKFGSATITNGNTNLNYSLSSTPTTGATGTISWNFGTIVNPSDGNTANDNITIDYTAIIQNTGGNIKGTNLNNSAHLEYVDGASVAKSTSNSGTLVTVIEPQLQVALTQVTTGPYQVGDTVIYELTISHTAGSNAEAYDTQLTDLLPAGLTYQSYTAGTGNPGAPSINGQQIIWGNSGNMDIPLGSSYTFRIKAVLASSVQPEQSFDNSVGVTWTSTDGTNSDEKSYGSATSNTITINTVNNTGLNKSILGSPTYVIGETFDYQIVARITKGTTRNVVVQDTLPAGVAFVSATINYSSGMTYSVPTNPVVGSTGAISWNFANVVSPGDSDTITIRYTVQILNVLGNQAGNSETNAAYVSYLNAMGTVRDTATQVCTFTVKEPQLVMSKSYANGTYDAGDTVHVTIQVWHNPTASPNDVNAYDLIIGDPIPAGMTYVNGTANNGGALNGGTMTWNINTMDLNFSSANKLTLSYDLKLDDTGKPGQTFNSTATTSWTSLSGTVTEERTGAGGVNDYEATGAASTQITDHTTLVKTITGSGPYPVGATVSYRLTMTLNEGTTNSVTVKDVLPTGLKFGSATITKGTNNISYTIGSTPVNGATGTIAWNFGDIVNASDGNGSNDYITIDYTAIIQNIGGNIKGTNLNNSAHLDYVDGNNTAKSTANSGTLVTVIEPQLQMALTEVTTGPYKAGDPVSYQVTISHTAGSNANAYDLQLTDLLPTGLIYQSYTAGTGDPGTPAINGQQLLWGSSGNINIPLGSSYTFRINAVLVSTVEPSQSMDNTVSVQWSSTAGTNSDKRVYNPVNSNTVNITSVDNTAVTKNISGSPTFVIGETFDYQVVVSVNQGTTKNLTLQDTLPAGVAFISANINKTAGLSYTGAATDPPVNKTGLISWDFGNVTSLNANDKITVTYKVQILNDIVNRAGYVKSNAVILSYKNASGTTLNKNANYDFTVQEPQLVVDKSYSVAESWQAGDPVTATIKIYYNSTSTPYQVTAYNVKVIDQVPAKLLNPNLISDSGTFGAGNVSWTIAQIENFHDINNPVILTYQVTLANDIQPNERLTGIVDVRWESLAGSVSQKRTGVDGAGALNLNNYDVSTSASTNTADITGFTHSLVGGVENAIGAKVPVKIQIQINEGTTNHLVAQAVLPAGLQFDHAQIVKGHNEISYSGPTFGNNGTQLSWDFGTVMNLANNNNNDDTITITYWVTVKNTQANQQSTVLNILAHLEYVNGQGSDIVQPDQNVALTLVEPNLQISKTGPGTVALKVAATFTIQVTNNGNGTAWQPVITDTLPSEMRTQAPILTAISVGSPARVLHETTDYDVTYVTNSNSGQWQFILKSGAARIAPGETLTITYQAFLNNEVFTVHTITNTATIPMNSYYSLDSSGGVGSDTRTYPSGLVTATASVTIQTPILVITATVDKLTAYPGDKLHYRIVINNTGNSDITAGTLAAESGVEYLSNMIKNLSSTSGVTSINGTGGACGTGSLSITGVNIINTNGQLTVDWDVTLKPFLQNGIYVHPTAQFTFADFPTPITITMPQTLIQSTNLKGTVWWDQNCDNVNDASEPKENNWVVEVLQHDTLNNSDTLITSTTTGSNGTYQFTGLVPGTGYKVSFKNPTGQTVWKTFDNIQLVTGVATQQDLPLHPTGVVYDAVTRQPVAGATIKITGPNGEQDLVTDGQGFYMIDTASGDYVIEITPPNTYSPVFPSTIIPQQQGVLPVTGLWRITNNPAPPQGNEPTTYYLKFNLVSGAELINNHIPLDPILQGSVVLTKTTAKKTAAIGDFVPYTVKLVNQVAALIKPLTLQDKLPSGFKYAKGSARVNGVAVEPTGDTTLSWSNLSMTSKGTLIVTYDLIIGSHVVKGNTYKNAATAIHGITGTALSNTGQAIVQVVGDPLFTDSLIIGKVFNDKNANGVQDEGEDGIAKARIITTSGQIITTDNFGRYHLEGLRVSNSGRGQNFVLKVDPRSVPAGMIFTTENPRVVRLTQGIMAKVNFGLWFPPEKLTSVIPVPTAQPVVTPYPELTVTKATPDEGLVNTKVAIIIDGTGFRSGAKVVFSQNQAMLGVSNIVLVSETQISCDLDLNGANIGQYDLTVTNDDGKSGLLAKAFTVKQPEPRNRTIPQKGFNNGSLLVTLEGPDIVPGITVKFINATGTTIPGIIITTQKGKIEAFFNLKDQPVGRYDCYVFYPDGHSTKLDNSLEIRVFSPELYHAQTLVPVYFDFDKSNIRTNQLNGIEHDLAVLLDNPNASIMLGGYTDERGSYIYNLGLSMRRVTAVKQYLVDHGVKPEQISIYSYGKDFAKKGNDENVWQIDRRVDVVKYEERQ